MGVELFERDGKTGEELEVKIEVDRRKWSGGCGCPVCVRGVVCVRELCMLRARPKGAETESGELDIKKKEKE